MPLWVSWYIVVRIRERWRMEARRIGGKRFVVWLKEHIQSFHLGWDDEHGQRSAQEMYDLIFNMKFLPPGMRNDE